MNIGGASGGIHHLTNYFDVIISLGITIFSEILIFLLLLRRYVVNKEVLIWVIFIIGLNFFTNPLAQMLYSLPAVQEMGRYGWFLTEALVILVEAIIINQVMLQPFQMAFIYSWALNGSSIILGDILCLFNILPWCS